MHSIAKTFDIIKYLKKRKKSKINKKRKERIGKMAPKGPNFFSGEKSSKQNKKMSTAKLNSVQWLERYSLSHTC